MTADFIAFHRCPTLPFKPVLDAVLERNYGNVGCIGVAPIVPMPFVDNVQNFTDPVAVQLGLRSQAEVKDQKQDAQGVRLLGLLLRVQ